MVRGNLRHGTRTTRRVVDAVYNLSEGQPFFNRRNAEIAGRGGRYFPDDGKWIVSRLETCVSAYRQVSLRERLQRLFRLLPAKCCRLLPYAGRRFDFALLQHISRSTETDCCE